MDNPSESVGKPPLTAAKCYDISFVQEFLRQSRSAMDDRIKTYLNALPERGRVNPQETSLRVGREDRLIDDKAFYKFESILFDEWQKRSDVLNFCNNVAQTMPPPPPASETTSKPVDWRFDPYSSRPTPSETKADELESVIRSEQQIEDIVRHRSWQIITQRCPYVEEKDWESAFRKRG